MDKELRKRYIDFEDFIEYVQQYVLHVPYNDIDYKICGEKFNLQYGHILEARTPVLFEYRSEGYVVETGNYYAVTVKINHKKFIIYYSKNTCTVQLIELHS